MKHLMAALMAALMAFLTTPALADFTETPMAPPPQEVIDQAQNDPSCFLYEGLDTIEMWTGATLGPNTRIHLIPCQLAAYNMSAKVILERRNDDSDISTWETLSFARYSDELGWTASDTLTNADIDAETGRLTEFVKGRGIGDCGSVGTWIWNGYQFAMIEYAYEGECNGRLADEWPIIFQRTSPPDSARTPDAVIDNPDARPDAGIDNPDGDMEWAACSVAPFCEDRAYFKDFLVACRAQRRDGSRFCSANTYVHNASAPAGFDYQLRVSRDRISAPLRISMIAVDNMMSRKDTVDVHVDGIRQILLAPDEIETPDSINEYFIGPQDLTDGLIDGMKAGSSIRFDYTNEAGEDVSVSFSLSGLTASLLWMQEFGGF